MAFKINISQKGKTLKLETENESLIGIKIGETLKGEEINADLSDYELEITGTSDIAGFPGMKEKEGPELKKVLLKRGFGMKKTKKGLRLRKTVRGNTISKNTVQINMIVKKEGKKKFEDLFPKKETEEKVEETEGIKEGSSEEKNEEK